MSTETGGCKSRPPTIRACRSRPIEIMRGGWGVAIIVAPRLVLERVHHLEVDQKSLLIARILGARQLAQAVLSGIRPSPEVLAMGVWVDTAHAISAIGLALLDRSRSRAGLTDATVATVWAMVGHHDLVGATPTPVAHDRRRDQLARLVLNAAPGGRPLLRRAEADRC